MPKKNDLEAQLLNTQRCHNPADCHKPSGLLTSSAGKFHLES